ncbi:Plasmodium exported protein, unknown function [Plasmodium knowlesi strain H]|uniref:S-antigen protein n=2 Tax=Plasmodium knowlesi TaxID=5850 RepID=A0A679KYJ2_PLAKH|nr:Plasmodium exported protein, unknown function [Plasmodium knowlesi strain H]OTN67140.1 Uncharacterized protein PKNOH_S07470800 [Plasmodium knowlesi]CAA9988832.1 Plasmodium exported protein, unknown function [Plasmodium knowlesi strain H]VVS78306.1 Plasmodium exported protein, unknown function [Plasmodium knowlesi strain H]
MAPFSFTKLSILAFVLYIWEYSTYHQDDTRRQGVHASLQLFKCVGRNLGSTETEEEAPSKKNKSRKGLFGKKRKKDEVQEEDPESENETPNEKKKTTSTGNEAKGTRGNKGNSKVTSSKSGNMGNVGRPGNTGNRPYRKPRGRSDIKDDEEYFSSDEDEFIRK